MFKDMLKMKCMWKTNLGLKGYIKFKVVNSWILKPHVTIGNLGYPYWWRTSSCNLDCLFNIHEHSGGFLVDKLLVNKTLYRGLFK